MAREGRGALDSPRESTREERQAPRIHRAPSWATAIVLSLAVLCSACAREPGEAVAAPEVPNPDLAHLELQVAEPNSVSNAVWGHGDGFIQITLQMTATQATSQFAQKTITCNLDGRRMPEAAARRPGDQPDPAVWSVSFEAQGVPRDLVHPVADAVEQQVESYLAGIASNTG